VQPTTCSFWILDVRLQNKSEVEITKDKKRGWITKKQGWITKDTTACRWLFDCTLMIYQTNKKITAVWPRYIYPSPRGLVFLKGGRVRIYTTSFRIVCLPAATTNICFINFILGRTTLDRGSEERRSGSKGRTAKTKPKRSKLHLTHQATHPASVCGRGSKYLPKASAAASPAARTGAADVAVAMTHDFLNVARLSSQSLLLLAVTHCRRVRLESLFCVRQAVLIRTTDCLTSWNLDTAPPWKKCKITWWSKRRDPF